MDRVAEDTIEITRKEYFHLRQDAERLSRLEIAGVDNWHNYSEAIYDAKYNDGISFEDFVLNLEREIF